MIRTSSRQELATLRVEADCLIYGLGYESRCLEVARRAEASNYYALKMPAMDVHRYDENVAEAQQRGHSVITDFAGFVASDLRQLFATAGIDPVNVAVDISSINRTMLFALLTKLCAICRPQDRIVIYYTPAAFDEPDWRFPQIEGLGPISPEYSGFEADPSRPLCLILGLGFEPGVSMGIVSQLEPSASFCFWGTGSDVRFEAAVRRANFEFEFTGFRTRTSPYLIYDPLGAYGVLESLAYGLVRDFNVVVVPMGPKIFAFLSFLLAMSYPGQLAVWRVQQRRTEPYDAKADKDIVEVELDTRTVNLAAIRRSKLIYEGPGSKASPSPA